MKKNLIIIAWVSFLVYLPSLFFGFTYFDDNVLVLENQNFLTNWTNFLAAFNREVFHVFGGGAGYYRPILTLSFMWDALWGGASPFMYHLTNILLHVIVSCLVYIVLGEILTNINQYYPILSNTNKAKNKNSNGAMEQSSNRSLIFFLSLLFSVHPIMVQAVSWIPGRNDSLLSLFILLSFIYFLKLQKSHISEQRTAKLYFWHFIFFLGAFFTKETALVFPVLLLFWLWFTKSITANLKLIIGWFFCVFIFLVIKQNVVGSLATGMTVQDIVWSVWKNLPAVFVYAGKIFLPINLSVLPILADSNAYLGVMVILFVCFVLLIFSIKSKFKIQNYKFIFFGLLWFFAFLLPSFVRPDLNGIADFLEHRVYLSLFGILLIIQNLELNIEKSRWLKSFLTATLLVLGIITIVHQFPFRDRLAFWTQAVGDAPHSPLAHKNLGAMLYLDGNQTSAFKEFQIAGQLNPKETIVHNNLGLIYMNKGEFGKAEVEYKQELKINPMYDNAYYNYGFLKYKMGNPADAEKLWQKTVEINPGYADAWKNLIGLMTAQKNNAKAQMYLMKAQQIGVIK